VQDVLGHEELHHGRGREGACGRVAVVGRPLRRASPAGVVAADGFSGREFLLVGDRDGERADLPVGPDDGGHDLGRPALARRCGTFTGEGGVGDQDSENRQGEQRQPGPSGSARGDRRHASIVADLARIVFRPRKFSLRTRLRA
jgi:hypothetical protein